MTYNEEFAFFLSKYLVTSLELDRGFRTDLEKCILQFMNNRRHGEDATNNHEKDRQTIHAVI